MRLAYVPVRVTVYETSGAVHCRKRLSVLPRKWQSGIAIYHKSVDIQARRRGTYLIVVTALSVALLFLQLSCLASKFLNNLNARCHLLLHARLVSVEFTESCLCGVKCR